MAILRHSAVLGKRAPEGTQRDRVNSGPAKRDTVQEKGASELGCSFFHLEKGSTKQKTGREGGKADRKPVLWRQRQV